MSERTSAGPRTDDGTMTIPEFDPYGHQTIGAWLREIEHLREKHSWDDTTTSCFVACKLRGSAKTWYDDLEPKIMSWSEWKRELIAAFYDQTGFTGRLRKALDYVKRDDQTMSEYLWMKMLLLAPCHLRGIDEVDAIINGIEDSSTRTTALASGITEPQVLFAYLNKIGGSDPGDTNRERSSRDSRNRSCEVQRKRSGGARPDHTRKRAARAYRNGSGTGDRANDFQEAKAQDNEKDVGPGKGGASKETSASFDGGPILIGMYSQNAVPIDTATTGGITQPLGTTPTVIKVELIDVEEEPQEIPSIAGQRAEGITQPLGTTPIVVKVELVDVEKEPQEIPSIVRQPFLSLDSVNVVRTRITTALSESLPPHNLVFEASETTVIPSKLMAGQETCPVCSKQASQKCGGCRSTVYCSREHQVAHWPIHKKECTSVKIAVSEKWGPYLVAARDLKEGELILTEPPLVLGPKADTKPVCVGCLHEFQTEDSLEYCESCGWPVCEKNCSKSSLHSKECKLYKNFGYKAPNIVPNDSEETVYGLLAPLRCLLLSEQNSKKLNELQGHLDERINTTIYRKYRKDFVPLFRDTLKLGKTEEEFLKVFAILDTNSFEIRGMRRQRGRAIYHRSAMMAHNCRPNTRNTFEPKAYALSLYATRPIVKGQPLTTTFTQTLWATTRRKAHLKEKKCFDCACERCSDPTELGTHAGSVICSKCGGFVNSTQPLDPKAAWKCDKCGKEIPGKQMSWGNEAIRSEIASLPLTHPNPLENFLDKYKHALHPTNSHVLEVTNTLRKIYGGKRLKLVDLDDEQLGRKIELTRQLLIVADKLAPGATRWRGQLLFGLQEALVMWTKNEYEYENITKEKAEETLGEAMKLLEEAIIILRVESDLAALLPEQLSNLTSVLESP